MHIYIYVCMYIYIHIHWMISDEWLTSEFWAKWNRLPELKVATTRLPKLGQHSWLTQISSAKLLQNPFRKAKTLCMNNQKTMESDQQYPAPSQLRMEIWKLRMEIPIVIPKKIEQKSDLPCRILPSLFVFLFFPLELLAVKHLWWDKQGIKNHQAFV